MMRATSMKRSIVCKDIDALMKKTTLIDMLCQKLNSANAPSCNHNTVLRLFQLESRYAWFRHGKGNTIKQVEWSTRTGSSSIHTYGYRLKHVSILEQIKFEFVPDDFQIKFQARYSVVCWTLHRWCPTSQLEQVGVVYQVFHRSHYKYWRQQQSVFQITLPIFV